MNAGEHALAALQGLNRARHALDQLWRDCRLSLPTPQEIDKLVFGVAAELAGVHDNLEHVIEETLRDMIDQDPQRMTIADWQEESEDA